MFNENTWGYGDRSNSVDMASSPEIIFLLYSFSHTRASIFQACLRHPDVLVAFSIIGKFGQVQEGGNGG